jgi:PPE family
MAGELRSRTCLWIGAGSIALGVGAALAGGSGVAHADSTSKSPSSASSPAKHQTAASSRTHSDTRSTVKPASEKKTERSLPNRKRPSTAVPAQLAAPRQAADDSDDPIDTDEEIDAQAQEIAHQAEVIDDERQDFAAEVNTVVSHLDVATLPSELNGTRVYTGTATVALLEAASTWNRLARDLNSAANAFESVLSLFGVRPATGLAATATATAEPPPALGFLTASAGQAQQASAQAAASSQAFEAAFVSNVPPSVIAANRAQLMAMTAVNLFSFNPPAVASTGALYVEMWAQDVSAHLPYF